MWKMDVLSVYRASIGALLVRRRLTSFRYWQTWCSTVPSWRVAAAMQSLLRTSRTTDHAKLKAAALYIALAKCRKRPWNILPSDLVPLRKLLNDELRLDG